MNRVSKKYKHLTAFNHCCAATIFSLHQLQVCHWFPLFCFDNFTDTRLWFFFPNNKYVYILYSSVYLGYVWIKFPLSIYNNTDLSLVWNAWEFLIQMWDHRSNNFHIYWCSKSTDKSTHLHICLNHQNNCFMFCFQTKPQDAVRTMLERCPNP